MSTSNSTHSTSEIHRLFKTVGEMSRVSGIGKNKLRQLMEDGELEYVQNGNRRLLTEEAILNWYSRAKTQVSCPDRK